MNLFSRIATVATTTTLLAGALVGVTPSAQASDYLNATCRFDKVGQPTLQMGCQLTLENDALVITWADGAVDHYTFINRRNNISKMSDGLGNSWYVKIHSSNNYEFQHEAGDRRVFVFG